jgi:O-antigen ligase
MTAAAAARYVQAARSVTRGGLIALGASIPISVALDNVLAVVVVLSWLAATRFDETLQSVRRNPVALFACVWFVAHALGAIYSIGDASDIARALRKAATFLLIPIAVTVMQEPRDRDRALWAFMAAIALTIVLSCLRSAGVIPVDAPLLHNGEISASVVFKARLTHSVLLAFGAFVLAVYARQAAERRWRIALYALAGVAVFLVIFVGDGRTGQLVAFVLIVYYGAWAARGRGVALSLAGVLAIAACAYAVPQSGIHKRAALAADEAADWQGGAVAPGASVGQRLEFYTNSLAIAARHPFLGVGTGGFAAAYEREVGPKGAMLTRNPHDEYLLKATELGLPGLFLLVALFWVFWRTARRLARPQDIAIARGAVITIAAASIVSSTLNDHTESLLFVWATGVALAGLRPHLA